MISVDAAFICPYWRFLSCPCRRYLYTYRIRYAPFWWCVVHSMVCVSGTPSEQQCFTGDAGASGVDRVAHGDGSPPIGVLPLTFAFENAESLMRWVYHTLYPLIAPQLHPKQFGGRQGSSTAHATQAFLQELGHMADREAVLAFDVYHAFDSPPKIPHSPYPPQDGHTRQATAPNFSGACARCDIPARGGGCGVHHHTRCETGVPPLLLPIRDSL